MTILESIRSAGPKPDKVPDGWYTTQQIASALGDAEVTACRKIREQVRQGKAVMRKFKIQTQGRGVYPVPHYKATK